MAELAPTEIVALARVMHELDYYQLMHVQRGVNLRELKRAYYATSRAFHPDCNRQLEGDLGDAVAQIAKRLSEAYTVLRDPRRREAYDHQLDAGCGVRQQLVQARDARGVQPKEAARTPQGRQYWSLAQADLSRGDHAAAARNLQTALTFEPDNAALRTALEAARQAR
ncbi:MAG: J domain-containing protein [Deltaproteobacteria bacterium]|nr:J domain-containing protein [Deltaproteobacteria bacterium]MBW2361069.1 J domain-containing protein [Deltaproteobacteria bacterium]